MIDIAINVNLYALATVHELGLSLIIWQNKNGCHDRTPEDDTLRKECTIKYINRKLLIIAVYNDHTTSRTHSNTKGSFNKVIHIYIYIFPKSAFKANIYMETAACVWSSPHYTMTVRP